MVKEMIFISTWLSEITVTQHHAHIYIMEVRHPKVDISLLFCFTEGSLLHDQTVQDAKIAIL